MALLRETPVGSLFPHHMPSIITVNKKDTMSSAFQTLIDNKILSAPVWDLHKHKFVAFVDMVDMVSASMEALSESDLASEADLGKLMESAVQLRNKTVGELADHSQRNPYLPVESTAPLHEAVKLMNKWGVHRVPVIDAEGNLMSVLTQSQVVHWFCDHRSSFPTMKKTLENLHIGQSGIISISWNSRAIEAFQLIWNKRISAVAVVNDDGILVGNISVSDLKLIGYDATLISRLFYPIKEFLRVIRAPHDAEHPISQPIFVKKDSTLGEVVRKLVETRFHRVYVVDENYKPVGVVSNLEVLKALCSCD